MADEFSVRDELLQSQGIIVVYFLLFRQAEHLGEMTKITRRGLLDFRERLSENRTLAETEYAESSFELLEFDRLNQQGTNDASSIRERFEILAKHIGLSDVELDTAPATLDSASPIS